MPDEAAVLEAPAEIAEPVTEAPPTPLEPVEVPAEGDVTQAEGDQGIDLAPVEAEIAAEVERRVTERAEKAEADAARRGLQRTKEADDGESARMQLYATAEAGAQRSAAELRRLAQSGEVDDAVLNEHFNPIIAGVQALAAKANESTIKGLIDLLPEMTDAERETLDPLLYDFRRNGRFDKLPATVVELALSRKDAEIKDLKKQLDERTAITAAAAKLAAAANAAGPGVGAETPAGKAAGKATTYAELTKMSPAEIAKMSPEQVAEITEKATRR
jgi:hypothetical protein